MGYASVLTDSPTNLTKNQSMMNPALRHANNQDGKGMQKSNMMKNRGSRCTYQSNRCAAHKRNNQKHLTRILLIKPNLD
jgi:hypothetical protein